LEVKYELPDLLGLIDATSNRGFCAGVFDAADITTIANATIKATCFIIQPQNIDTVSLYGGV